MSYFRTCEHCGGNLDPGEKCDCRERKNQVQPTMTKIKYPKERRPHVSTPIGI